MSANVGNYRSVHLGQLQQVFGQFDRNRDGMDRNEINQAADTAKQHGDTNMFELLKTLTEGGVHGNGLSPELGYADGRVQFNEMVDLAHQGGDLNRVEVGDFQRGFGNQARPGGNIIGGGYGQQPSYGGPPQYGPPQAPPQYGPPQAPPQYGPPQAPPQYGPPQAPPQYGPPQAPPQYGGGQQGGMKNIMQTMMKLFQQLIPMLQQQGGGQRGGGFRPY